MSRSNIHTRLGGTYIDVRTGLHQVLSLSHHIFKRLGVKVDQREKLDEQKKLFYVLSIIYVEGFRVRARYVEPVEQVRRGRGNVVWSAPC